MKVLVLGANGMAGHMISLYLLERGYRVSAVSRQRVPFLDTLATDYKDLDSFREILISGGYHYIINCTGVLNQTAEKNKAEAVYINSFLPHFIAKTLEGKKCSLIHLSTDCVFSGAKGAYNENDFHDGATFYDKTKSIGEVNDSKNLTFRTSIVGPDINPDGIGLFNWFMKQESLINGFSKSIWSGVSTVTLARAIEAAMEQNLTGLYHLVNNQAINKYELLKLFSKHFKNRIPINSIDGVAADKSLVNTRKDFDFTVPDYEKMVIEIKEWICTHQAIYPIYYTKEQECE